ncbi:hypothetical protein Scep_010521 [Stephania cephalantha]|uniref:Uncharacterized protein n=1 Tax=Stephania cephalantha TaxID=152367 RepID=A0AAP0JW80_9MAGN
MGIIKRENGVLKLVHPGGYVEVLTEPVSAAEILRKNPRHCITRPDVFKFPWIVVRPESVLQPGRVFYVVPNHTLYSLLHQRHHASRHRDRYRHLRRQFEVSSSIETSPKHQQHEHHLKYNFSGEYKFSLQKQRIQGDASSETSKNLNCNRQMKQKLMTAAKLTSRNVQDRCRAHQGEVKLKSHSKGILWDQGHDRNSKHLQSRAKVAPLFQGMAPSSCIEKTHKHCTDSHNLNQQSLIKSSTETASRGQYYGRLERRPVTYPRFKVPKEDDSIESLADYSEVSNGITRRQYRGRLGQQPATYSLLQMIEKEELSKMSDDHSAVSDKIVIREQYHRRLKQQSGAYSWHEVTNKDYRRRFDEHSAVVPNIQERSSHGKALDIDDRSCSSFMWTTKQDYGVPNLRPCLREKGSERRCHGLKVTFVLPSENAEKPECSRNRFRF